MKSILDLIGARTIAEALEMAFVAAIGISALWLLLRVLCEAMVWLEEVTQ